MDLFSLKGKNILITGGAGHLGRAMSEALAVYGANVFIASRSLERCQKLAETLHNKYSAFCRGVELDISQQESTQKCIKEIIETCGRIDVLINNAVYSVSGFFEKLSESEWEKGIDGTINSVFRMCSAVIPHMMEHKQGNIINISSMYGMVSPDPSAYNGNVHLNNPACYGAGKAAVLQLTRYLAGYYGEYGIRCNSITPGPFPSQEVQRETWFVDNLAEKTMLKRIGNPEDLMGALILLASDSSRYMTGANICVDGGWTAW